MRYYPIFLTRPTIGTMWALIPNRSSMGHTNFSRWTSQIFRMLWGAKR